MKQTLISQPIIITPTAVKMIGVPLSYDRKYLTHPPRLCLYKTNCQTKNEVLLPNPHFSDLSEFKSVYVALLFY